MCITGVSAVDPSGRVNGAGAVSSRANGVVQEPSKYAASPSAITSSAWKRSTISRIIPSVRSAAQALTCAGAPGSAKSSARQSTPRRAAASAKAGTSR